MLTHRWAAWVHELATHPLDQFEYLGLVTHRDALATWLEVRGGSLTRGTVDEIDADFERLTVQDSRFAGRFLAQARLHGLATLSQAGRLRPAFYEQRLTTLVDQLGAAQA